MFTVTVAQGAQTLTGFRYSATSVTFGNPAPTVTEPSGAQTALSYSATPPAVCTVDPNSGVLTLEEVGDCEVTVTAVGTDDYEVATAMFTVMVGPAGVLVLKVNAIATDGTVNIEERAAGFAELLGRHRIGGGRDGDGAGRHGGADGHLGGGRSGDLVGERAGECGVHRGPERGGVGERGEDRLHRAGCADARAGGGSDGADGADVHGACVVARWVWRCRHGSPWRMAKGAQPLTGFRYSAISVTFGDTAPAVTVPSGAQGALSYSATPSTVCTVGPGSGALTIVGAGDCEVTVTAAVTADYEVATAMFTVAVAKGAQPLTGFRYSAASVTFGDTAPTVTVPSGAQGALSYSATAPAVCTVDPGSGALTIVGVGDCEVTVTAAVTADYEVATAMFTVTVAKGDQTLSGFQYSASNTVTFGNPAPTVTEPSGAQTALSYSATPPAVCTVNPNSGVLTLEEVGDCEVTVTAVGTDDYEEDMAMFTVTVDAGGHAGAESERDRHRRHGEHRGAGRRVRDLGRHRIGGGRDGDGEGGHVQELTADLFRRRSGDLVGERAGECGVHRGPERGGVGERGEDRLHRAGCADARAGGGPDGADGADVHGACVVAGGCGDRGDESRRRRRHPRVRRPGAAVGVEHRRGHRCHQRYPGHRQRQRRQRDGDGEGHGGQRRHGCRSRSRWWPRGLRR